MYTWVSVAYIRENKHSSHFTLNYYVLCQEFVQENVARNIKKFVLSYGLLPDKTFQFLIFNPQSTLNCMFETDTLYMCCYSSLDQEQHCREW